MPVLPEIDNAEIEGLYLLSWEDIDADGEVDGKAVFDEEPGGGNDFGCAGNCRCGAHVESATAEAVR